MAIRNSGQEEDISEINVVPLVDIILVVLIIFMVTAPMIMKPSINVNLPSAATGEQTNPSKLSFSVSADGRISLNGEIIDEQRLKQIATEEVHKSADVQAILAADRDVPHGKVVGILDLIKSVGVKKFAISIDKK